MDPLAGRTVGPYHLVELLGAGGFGWVYRAFHRDLGQHRAIKILMPNWARDHAFVTRFRMEARLAAGLEHPNIVPIYDVGEQGGLHFIVMPLLTGQSLRDLLRAQGALPLQRSVSLLTQLAAALDYAHGRGIAHRDVKPDNVFVSPDDRVTLVDFGIARATEGTSLTFAGTAPYMAPELLGGSPGSGAHHATTADLYALGIVAYEMVTGRAPFQGDQGQVWYAQLHTPPPSPRVARPELTAEAERVLLRQLAKSDHDRYPSATAFVSALRDVMSTSAQPAPTAHPRPRYPSVPESSSAPPPQPIPRFAPPSPSRPSGGRVRIVAAFAVLASVLLAALLALTLFRGSTAPSSPGTTVAPAQLAAPPVPSATTALPTSTAPPTLTPAGAAAPVRPTVTATPAPAGPVTPTPAPTSSPGQVVYQADWSRGLGEWSGGRDWKVSDGNLVNDGTDPRGSFIIAPYRHTSPDYAVEAEIQRVDTSSEAGFMIAARRDSTGGYRAGPHYNIAWIIVGDPVPSPDVAQARFSPGATWHFYRFEVQNNHLRLTIDGALTIEGRNDRFPRGDQTGLWSYGGARINVRSFRVIAL